MKSKLLTDFDDKKYSQPKDFYKEKRAKSFQ